MRPHSPSLHPAAVAALVGDGDEALVAQACLMSLVEKGTIRVELNGDPPGVQVVDLGHVEALTASERGWYDALFDATAEMRDGRRSVSLAEFFTAGGHREWRRTVDRELDRHRLLQSPGQPGFDGWSFSGWTMRAAWRRRLSQAMRARGTRASLGLAGVAMSLVLAGHALAAADGYVETESQQFLVAGQPVDGMPVVRLYNSLGRLIPLPASHTHDFHAGCNGTCGSGRFLGEHSCATSGGGPGTGV